MKDGRGPDARCNCSVMFAFVSLACGMVRKECIRVQDDSGLHRAEGAMMSAGQKGP